jgi:hypothetical protein
VKVAGLVSAVVLMFGNEMLLTSWLFASLCSALLLAHRLHPALHLLPPLLRIPIQVDTSCTSKAEVVKPRIMIILEEEPPCLHRKTPLLSNGRNHLLASCHQSEFSQIRFWVAIL